MAIGVAKPSNNIQIIVNKKNVRLKTNKFEFLKFNKTWDLSLI